MHHLISIAKFAVKQALQAVGSMAFHLQLNGRQNALTVLMYHRVLPRDDPRYIQEEPGMVVEPHTFDMHLKILSEHFNVVSLDNSLIESKTAGNSKPICAITFDDGWADNFEFAWPLLQKHKLPATIFLASDYIGGDLDFWPNQVNRLLSLEPEAFLQALELSVECNHQLTGREFRSDLIQRLKTYTDKEIYTALDELPEALQPLRRSHTPGLMTWEQVKQMANDPLVSFGSHTRKHYRLNLLSNHADLISEIELSRKDIEQQLGKKIVLFCYPNGNTSTATKQLVMDNYVGAVTTENGKNSFPLTTPHLLKRIAIHNDACGTAKAFKAKLSGLL